LLPAEGAGDKVMPTFSERQYAWEDPDRQIITLDSVSSHANRQEELLGQAWERPKLPVVRVKLGDEYITSYQASHRLYDALRHVESLPRISPADSATQLVHRLLGGEIGMLATDAGKRPTAGVVEQVAPGTQFLRRRHSTSLLQVLGVKLGDESVYVHRQGRL
jgi:hypothetical protein